MKQVAAGGICCDVCGLHRTVGYFCSFEVGAVAKEKVHTR